MEAADDLTTTWLMGRSHDRAPAVLGNGSNFRGIAVGVAGAQPSGKTSGTSKTAQPSIPLPDGFEMRDGKIFIK